MKIVSLIAENVKRLVAVEITPDGNLVQVTGKNGQGKTSVLDSIWWALAGASHIQAVPIRNGADRARIRLDLGDIIVTRAFSRKGENEYTSTIAVENADGARFPSPQKIIDSLLGELTFDPLEFARAKPKDQFDTLRPFVDLDFDAIEAAHKGDFERRTEINRFAKEARASASMIVIPSNTPKEAIDETALVKELQEAGDKNRDRDQRSMRRANFAEEIGRKKKRIDEMGEEYANLESQLADLRERIENGRKDIKANEEQLTSAEPLPDLIDVTEIRAKIESAREINANVTKLATKLKHEHLAIKYEQEAKDLTERIDNRQEAKRKAIAEAKMPIPGLGFGDGIVLLNGLPFDQASDAEQLRASVAIAASMKPKLRILRVRDGSLLDDDGMNLLAAIADELDMQIWVERVDSSGKIGFVLEEGSLKQPVAETAAA